MKCAEKSSSKSGGHTRGPHGESKAWDTKHCAGRAVESDKSAGVDEESLTSTRKMRTADKVEDNLRRKKRISR